MSQEMVYQTAGGAAETLTGGITMNLVPKDGGNQFRGGAKWAKSPESWQGNNLTDDLKAMGVTGVDRIKHFEEFNIEQGGPIVKNKLWFFGAFRQAYYDKPIANTFQTDGSLPYPQAYAACVAAGNCEQGVSDEKMANPVAPPHLADFGAQQVRRLLGSRAAPARSRDGRADRSEHRVGDLEHAELLDRFGEVDLDAVVEAAARSRHLVQPRALRQPLPARHLRRARHRRRGIATSARTTPAPSYLWNASSAQLGNYPDRYNVQGSLSYVTGAHNVKFGVMDQFGTYRRYNNANADLYQTYQNGAPLRVTVLNTPLEVQENLDANFGIYAQDSWNLGKLTLNYGARFDYLKQRIVGQPAMQGRFANVAAYDDIDAADLEGILAAPVGGLQPVGRRQDGGARRLQQVRDRADDRLRAALQPDGADHPGPGRGPTSTATTSPTASVVAPVIPSVGCEINFAGLPSNFGVRSLAQFDPDLKRPYQLAFNAGVTHEVLTGLTASFEYFRSDFRNITVRQNTLRTAASYDEFTDRQPARRQQRQGVAAEAGRGLAGRQRRQHQRRHEARL